MPTNDAQQDAVAEALAIRLAQLFGVLEPNEQDVAPFNRRSWRVASSGIQILRRVFSSNQALAESPELIMGAAVYLASKLEESYIQVKDVIKHCCESFTPTDLINREAFVAEILCFSLDFSHPQELIRGCFDEWKACESDALDDSTQQQLLQDVARTATSECFTLAFFVMCVLPLSEDGVVDTQLVAHNTLACYVAQVLLRLDALPSSASGPIQRRLVLFLLRRLQTTTISVDLPVITAIMNKRREYSLKGFAV